MPDDENGSNNDDVEVTEEDKRDIIGELFELAREYERLKKQERELEIQIAELEDENDQLAESHASMKTRFMGLAEKLSETQQKLQEVSQSLKNLRKYAAKIIPMSEPPFFPGIYMGPTSAVEHESREDDIREYFGIDLDLRQCWAIVGNQGEQVVNIEGGLEEEMERGQPVLLNSNRNVVAKIPDNEIEKMTNLQEATVAEVDNDGNIFIGGRRRPEIPAVLYPGVREDLGDEKLSVGDRVLVFLRSCIVRILEKKKLDTTKEVKQVDFDDVGGLDDKIQEIKDVLGLDFSVEALKGMGQEFPKGIVLHGPPGNGKTLLVAALANELGWHMEVLNGAEITSKWVGETPRMMRESFNNAKENKPAFWFIDEADAIFPVRGSSHSAEYKTNYISQFNTLIDGIEDNRGVFAVIATNRLDKIDPAVIRPERFSKKVRIPRPNEEAARSILRVHLRDRAIGAPGPREEILDKFIDKLVDDLYSRVRSARLFKAFRRGEEPERFWFRDLVSGALLKTLTDEIARRALNRMKAEGIGFDDDDFGIKEVDLENVVAQVLVDETPKDHNSLNQWLMVNGYRPASEFEFADILLEGREED